MPFCFQGHGVLSITIHYNSRDMGYCVQYFCLFSGILDIKKTWASSRDLSSGCQTKRVSVQSPQLQRLARKFKFYLQQVYICIHICFGLCLCCSQTPEDSFSRIEAQLIMRILPVFKGYLLEGYGISVTPYTSLTFANSEGPR